MGVKYLFSTGRFGTQKKGATYFIVCTQASPDEATGLHYQITKSKSGWGLYDSSPPLRNVGRQRKSLYKNNF